VKKRFTEAQIVGFLREADEVLQRGMNIFCGRLRPVHDRGDTRSRDQLGARRHRPYTRMRAVGSGYAMGRIAVDTCRPGDVG
jgi:hypothetical protein